MKLPPGFELEPAVPTAAAASNLPQGFQLEQPVAPPQRSYGLSEVPGAAVRNIPKSATQFYTGLAQAVLNPVETLTGLLDIGAGALRNTLPEGVVSFIDQFDSDPTAAKRASEMANAVGGMYKDRYGNYEAIKRTFAEDPVGAAADLSTILSGGASATARVAPTASGALSTAARVTNPLAPVGVAADVAKMPLKAGGQILEAAFNPKNAMYLRAAEGRGPEIVNALRGAQEIVPGSMPTAAQAAADTGVVGFQKMGKSAAGVLETEYAARAAQQAEAQLRAVRGVGKTAADIADSELTRANITRPMYKKADQILSKVDDDFTRLTERPSMQAAIARAERLAADKGIPFEIGRTANILDSSGKPLTIAHRGDLPGTSIHFIKQALDDMVTDPATFGIGKAEVGAVKQIRGEFLDWVSQTSKNPAYLEARDTFAKLSEPINQMKVGQFLEGKLVPALGEETARLRAAGYAGALDQAPSTIKRATGETRFQSLEDIFKNDPQALKALRDVRDDLARQAKSERLAAGKIGEGVDVRRATEALAGEGLLPNMINRITTTANDLWRRMRGRINESTAIEVATEMLHPGKAADVLEKAIKQQANRQAMGAAFNAPFEAFYVNPALVNMLAPQSENQNALVR
jgi:hypothetical protein